MNSLQKRMFFYILVFPVTGFAQNNSSPYSVLGIGDIENSYFNRYTGMANAGVALSDLKFINNSNAATLSSLGDRVFLFELSTRLKQVYYSGANIKSDKDKTTDFAVRRANIAIKVSKKWGTSVGLQPFSTAAYNYAAYKNVQGSNQSVPAEYQGEGGVNQFYWANGYRVTKNTSIGITSSFLFGSIKQTENLLENDLASSLTTVKNTYLRNFYFNFSAYTRKKISNRWTTSYGATYSFKTPLFAEYKVEVNDGDGNLVKKNETQNDYFSLPASLNLGIAMIKDDRYTFTINAQQQNWSNLNYGGIGYRLVNSNKVSAGFQHSMKAKNAFNNDYERSFFQLGLYAGNSYLKVNNSQLTDFGASVGYGRSLNNSPMSYSLSLEAGRRGTAKKELLSENYVNLNFTLSYLDIFYKGKRYH